MPGRWKTKTMFTTFPQPLATMIFVLYLNQKTKERKSAGYTASSFSYSDFMLILRLENADLQSAHLTIQSADPVPANHQQIEKRP